MTISPFFLDLRSAYQSEMDDLRFDSEGRDVLRQRLAEKRKEIDFLLQMMALSPEMVAVIFHQGFNFKSPAVMNHLLGHASEALPAWRSVAEGIELTPWAQALAEVILKAPDGEWFLTVAAGLEFMAGQPGAALAARGGHDESDEEEDDEEDDGDDGLMVLDSDGDGDDGQSGDTRTKQEAGADWLVDQGFDRKDR